MAKYMSMNSQLCMYSFGMTMQKFKHPTFTSENRGVVWCLVKQGLGKYNCTADKGMNKDTSCYAQALGIVKVRSLSVKDIV